MIDWLIDGFYGMSTYVGHFMMEKQLCNENKISIKYMI